MAFSKPIPDHPANSECLIVKGKGLFGLTQVFVRRRKTIQRGGFPLSIRQFPTCGEGLIPNRDGFSILALLIQHAGLFK